MRVVEWINRVVRLEPRIPVRISDRPGYLTIRADPDQLDQMLINVFGMPPMLRSNAWPGTLGMALDHGHRSRLTVDDEGHGVAQSSNLFVPFFTTNLADPVSVCF